MPLREVKDGRFVHYRPAPAPLPPRFQALREQERAQGRGQPQGFPPQPKRSANTWPIVPLPAETRPAPPAPGPSLHPGYSGGYPGRNAAYPDPSLHPPAYPAPYPQPVPFHPAPPPSSHPGAGLLSGAPAPYPPPDPGTQGLLGLKNLEDVLGTQSAWNGYKLMPPMVKGAVEQFDNATPLNINGFVNGNPHEVAGVFHQAGPGPLLPGPMQYGSCDKVALPADISLPSARVFLHSHPFTGNHKSDTPSMSDQLIARQYPGVHHVVQTPAPSLLEKNAYVSYSGAYPPRHYSLVENPLDLPVPPPSPDGMTPFHSYPDNGVNFPAGAPGMLPPAPAPVPAATVPYSSSSSSLANALTPVAPRPTAPVIAHGSRPLSPPAPEPTPSPGPPPGYGSEPGWGAAMHRGASDTGRAYGFDPGTGQGLFGSDPGLFPGDRPHSHQVP